MDGRRDHLLGYGGIGTGGAPSGEGKTNWSEGPIIANGSICKGEGRSDTLVVVPVSCDLSGGGGFNALSSGFGGGWSHDKEDDGWSDKGPSHQDGEGAGEGVGLGY